MIRRALMLALVVVLPDEAARAQGDPVAATRVALQKAKASAARQPRAAIAPREHFLRRAEIVDVRLAPDGRHLSFLRRGEKGTDVVVQDVSSGKETRLVAGLQRAELAWSGDGRRLWLADEQGLAVIESSSLTAKRIMKWDPRRSQKLWMVDARAPQYAVIYEKVAQRHRYLRVDVQGRTQLLIDAALPLRSALLDADGDLAFTAAFDGARYETVIRDHTVAGTRDLLRCSPIEECRLVGYSAAQKSVSILSQHDEDKFSLRRWRESSGRWDTVHRDPAGVADTETLLWNAAGETWLAVAYHGARRRWHGADGDTRALLAALANQLPDANLHLSPTTDRALWLVRTQSADRALDRYYLYRPRQSRLQPLFAREDVAQRMPPAGAPMHPVTYRASDGMLLHGYVLLPSGVAPASAPLVAWLHGGPIARVHDEYNGAIQLLVNRGYAVFVPNFRASSGYGLNYVLSAKGDVGNGRVLADIVEGLDFVLAQGIGDRARQAVMGMSFGGYASLLAVTHHPARFRFAFAGTPPTEYGWIKQWQAEHDGEAIRNEGAPLSLQFPLLGFPYQDKAWRARMQRESPLASLRSLQAPAYIWAGERDDRVPIKSVVHYVGEAQRLGKPISLLIDPDAGHGPASALGVEASLYMIEQAAHRHFGGALSPTSPELKAFLRKNVRIDANAGKGRGA